MLVKQLRICLTILWSLQKLARLACINVDAGLHALVLHTPRHTSCKILNMHLKDVGCVLTLHMTFWQATNHTKMTAGTDGRI